MHIKRGWACECPAPSILLLCALMHAHTMRQWLHELCKELEHQQHHLISFM